MVTEVLVVEEAELKGSAGRLRRVGATAERGVCLFQAAHRLPGLTQPPQGYCKPEHGLGRLVRSQAVLERGARLLPSSPAHSFQACLDYCGRLRSIVGVQKSAFPFRMTARMLPFRQTLGKPQTVYFGWILGGPRLVIIGRSRPHPCPARALRDREP
jgi:hypothetical protein